MAEWYYAQGGQQFGPLSDQELMDLVRQGSVQPGDLVWRDGMADWQEAGSVPELAGARPPQAYQAPQYQAPQHQQPSYQQPSYQQPEYEPQPTQATRVPIGYYNPGAQRRGSPPPNYLVQAILCTLCCCLPFGIVAIVMAAQVNGKYQSGDYRGALEKSESAKTWCWVAFICGLVANGISFAVQMANQ